MHEDILADFVEAKEFAASLKPPKHYRTIHRWMNEGLPSIKLGAQRFVHLPGARAWIMRKLRGANPERRRTRRGGP